MRGFRYLLGLLIILAACWLGVWWYAEGRMQNGVTAWAEQLATQGWKVSYDRLQRGTSPAAATLTLTNLVLSPPADSHGETGAVTLPVVALRIELLDPMVLHTDLPQKISVAVGQTINAVVSFGSVALDQELDPHVLFHSGAFPYRSGSFNAAGVDILASDGSLLVLHLDSIATHYAFDPDAGADRMAFTGTEQLNGVAISPLVARLLSIPFGGKVASLSLNLGLSGPVPPDLAALAARINAIPASDEADRQKLFVPVVHDWAAKGGNGNFGLGAVVGPTTLASDGALKFDANLQPQGTADVTADHLDEFTQAVTNAYPETQAVITAWQAQLSAYITSTPLGGQSLAMHVAYGDGAVNVNGMKTSDLPPIDWTALENPAPVQAPTPAPPPVTGDGANTPTP